jgi:hypothetical protein
MIHWRHPTGNGLKEAQAQMYEPMDRNRATRGLSKQYLEDQGLVSLRTLWIAFGHIMPHAINYQKFCFLYQLRCVLSSFQ